MSSCKCWKHSFKICNLCSFFFFLQNLFTNFSILKKCWLDNYLLSFVSYTILVYDQFFLRHFFQGHFFFLPPQDFFPHLRNFFLLAPPPRSWCSTSFIVFFATLYGCFLLLDAQILEMYAFEANNEESGAQMVGMNDRKQKWTHRNLFQKEISDLHTHKKNSWLSTKRSNGKWNFIVPSWEAVVRNVVKNAATTLLQTRAQLPPQLIMTEDTFGKDITTTTMTQSVAAAAA